MVMEIRLLILKRKQPSKVSQQAGEQEGRTQTDAWKLITEGQCDQPL